MRLEIFTEAFTSRLLPLFDEVTIAAIRQFHPEEYPLDAVIAGLGALCASALLYGFGVWLRRMPQRISTEEQRTRVAKLEKHLCGWLPYLLILSPTPVGNAIIIASGFFCMRPRTAGIMILLAEIIWRASPLLGHAIN